MKLTTAQRVPLPEARRRALAYLAKQHDRDLIAANSVAQAIWPDHQMTAQGAGAAASRILRGLVADELVIWDSQPAPRAWGYRITYNGLAAAVKDRLLTEVSVARHLGSRISALKISRREAIALKLDDRYVRGLDVQGDYKFMGLPLEVKG